MHIIYSQNKFFRLRLDNLFVVADAVILRIFMDSLVYKEKVNV